MDISRKCNMELLRILAMLMIIGLHFLLHCIIDNREVTGVYFVFAWILEAFCYQSVNVFVMLTGYFSIGKKKTNFKRLFSILKLTWFYSLGFFVIFLIFTRSIPPIKSILLSILPFMSGHYWFITAYIILQLFVPYINLMVDKLSTEQLRRRVCLLVLVFCVVRTVYPFADDRFISSGGASIPWFITLYLTGYYLQSSKEQISTKLLVLINAVCVLIPTITKLAYIKILGRVDGSSVFYHHNSLFMYVGAISLLLLFTKLDIRSAKVSHVIIQCSSATLGVYIIHENIFVKTWLWNYINSIHHTGNIIGPIFEILTILAIFAGCTLIELTRQFVIKKCHPRILLLINIVKRRIHEK